MSTLWYEPFTWHMITINSNRLVTCPIQTHLHYFTGAEVEVGGRWWLSPTRFYFT